MPMRDSLPLPAARANASESERQRPPAAASVRRLAKRRRFISCAFKWTEQEKYLDKGANRVIETFCLVLQQKARLKLSTRRSGCRAPQSPARPRRGPARGARGLYGP